MKKLWQELSRRLEQGQAMVLVTVTAASGATPRGAGARMLMGQQGCLCGTIGGGEVEYRAQQMAMELLAQPGCMEREFSLNRKDVENLGMVCGGRARVYFQYIPAGDTNTLAVAQQALAREETGEETWLVSDLEDNGKLCLYSREDMPRWLLPWMKKAPTLVEESGQRCYVEQLISPGRVYLFGAGHVAQELEPVLSHLGFRCVVLDDRPEFADPGRFPTAQKVLCVDFSRIAEYVQIGREDYVCVMTRGHAADTLVQAQVLSCHPRYNGMIGSRAKSAAVRQALEMQYGYSPEEIAQIISPIGLSIGGRTPEEIAISIAAQMIAIRAGKTESST